MKVQLNFSAETSTFLLEQKSELFTVTFVSISDKTGLLTLEFESVNAEALAMGLFFAGQDFTMKQVKRIFNENSLPA